MILIRIEEERDYEAINRVIESAFEKQDECRLVERIRQSNHYIEALSLVAVDVTSKTQERVVGHLLMSQVTLEHAGQCHDALALAPVSVEKAYQNKGIGKEMMAFALKEAERFGHKVVTVLGHPDYYPKVGFEISDVYDIQPPFEVRRQFFMAHRLNHGAESCPKGKVIYPSHFYE